MSLKDQLLEVTVAVAPLLAPPLFFFGFKRARPSPPLAWVLSLTAFALKLAFF